MRVSRKRQFSSVAGWGTSSQCNPTKEEIFFLVLLRRLIILFNRSEGCWSAAARNNVKSSFSQRAPGMTAVLELKTFQS